MKAAGLLALWALVSVPVAVALALVIRASSRTLADQVEEYLYRLGMSGARRRIGRVVRIGVVVAVAATVLGTSVRLVGDVPERLLAAGIRNRDRFGPPPVPAPGPVEVAPPGRSEPTTGAPEAGADSDREAAVEAGEIPPEELAIDFSGLRAPRAEITTARAAEGRATQAGGPSSDADEGEQAPAEGETDGAEDGRGDAGGEEPEQDDEPSPRGDDPAEDRADDGPAADDAARETRPDEPPATAPETPPADPEPEPEPEPQPPDGEAAPAAPGDVDVDGVADDDDGVPDADAPDREAEPPADDTPSIDAERPAPSPAAGGGAGGARSNGLPARAAAPAQANAAVAR